MTPSLLSTPVALPCGVTLPNRLAKAAMAEGLAEASASPGDALTRLYGRWARGGAGLLVTGNVMVDRRHLSEDGNVAIEDDRDLDALGAWARAARSGGGQVFVQLNHPGRQTPRTLDAHPVAPSAVPLSLGAAFAPPRALTVDEIEDIVRRFAVAAGVAKRAGFGGVEVHGAHGYLVSQFLSPLANVRDDAYGGDAPRRRRFLLEVVAAIRAEVGPAFPVAVKLNSADFQRGGFDEAESLDVVRALGAAGVDLLEISGGTYEQPAMTGAKRSTREREAYFLEFAERVREVSTLPLMLTGGFRTRAVMEDAIATGKIDVVGLARPLAFDPDLPRALLAERAGADPVTLRRTGIAALDGLAEVAWYGWQIRAMGRGEEPRPDLTTLQATGSYLVAMVAGRMLRRGPAMATA